MIRSKEENLTILLKIVFMRFELFYTICIPVTSTSSVTSEDIKNKIILVAEPVEATIYIL